jgi:hypothetical protein
MSSSTDVTDSGGERSQFGADIVVFLSRQWWVLSIILIGIVFVMLGGYLSGLIGGLTGLYGLLLIAIGALIYLFLFVLRVQMGR